MSEDFSDRTRSTLEHGTRIAEDRRTQTERINGPGPGRFGPAAALLEPEINHDAPALPYRTTEWSVMGGVRTPPGTILLLQPHELAPHHVPTEEAMDLLKEFAAKLEELAAHVTRADEAAARAEKAADRLEAAAAIPETPPAKPAKKTDDKAAPAKGAKA